MKQERGLLVWCGGVLKFEIEWSIREGITNKMAFGKSLVGGGGFQHPIVPTPPPPTSCFLRTCGPL